MTPAILEGDPVTVQCPRSSHGCPGLERAPVKLGNAMNDILNFSYANGCNSEDGTRASNLCMAVTCLSLSLSHH